MALTILGTTILPAGSSTYNVTLAAGQMARVTVSRLQLLSNTAAVVSTVGPDDKPLAAAGYPDGMVPQRSQGMNDIFELMAAVPGVHKVTVTVPLSLLMTVKIEAL